jgi:hypothetical protein
VSAEPTDEQLLRIASSTPLRGHAPEYRAVYRAGFRAALSRDLPENVRPAYVWFCSGHNNYGDEWFMTPNEAADDYNVHIGDTHD